MPQSFKQVTKISRVPKNATILTGGVSAIAAGIFPTGKYRSLSQYLYLSLSYSL